MKILIRKKWKISRKKKKYNFDIMFIPVLSKEDLQDLPLLQFDQTVVVVDRAEQVDEMVQRLRKYTVLGFDTETRPAFTKGLTYQVSLLQLAVDQEVFLFRIHKTGIPQSLADLLADASVLKVGVAIKHDIDILRKITPFRAAGFLDLQDFVKSYGIESKGLSKLSGIILGHRISKSQQLSNWESPELLETQKRYAATDAWICLQIYKKLLSVEQ